MHPLSPRDRTPDFDSNFLDAGGAAGKFAFSISGTPRGKDESAKYRHDPFPRNSLFDGSSYPLRADCSFLNGFRSLAFDFAYRLATLTAG